MKGKWLWLLIAAVFLLLGVIGLEVWKYAGTGQTESKELPEELTSEFDPMVSERTKSQGIPDELTSGFDPTVNQAGFAIEEDFPERNSLRLRVVFPRSWENRRYESRITCQEEDIRVVYRSGSELTGSAALFAVIGKTTLQDLNFFGRCADVGCEEINRDCFLSVAREEGSGL